MLKFSTFYHAKPSKLEKTHLSLLPYCCVCLIQNLCYKWGAKLTPAEVDEKVKYFFKYYSINRHKMTVLTPSYHAEVCVLCYLKNREDCLFLWPSFFGAELFTGGQSLRSSPVSV